MSSVPEKEYLFKLVAFPDDDDIDPVSIDIVPGIWIFYDAKKGQLFCYYMAGKLTEKKKKQIRKMVQQCSPPAPDWPAHRVDVKGRAHTYQDAEKGIKKLEKKKYAFSTDDEIKCQQKILQERNRYQRSRPPADSETVEEQLERARADLNNKNGVDESFLADRSGSNESSVFGSDLQEDETSSEDKVSHVGKSSIKKKKEKQKKTKPPSPKQYDERDSEPSKKEQRRESKKRRQTKPTEPVTSKHPRHDPPSSKDVHAGGDDDPVIPRSVSESPGTESDKSLNNGPSSEYQTPRRHVGSRSPDSNRKEVTDRSHHDRSSEENSKQRATTPTHINNDIGSLSPSLIPRDSLKTPADIGGEPTPWRVNSEMMRAADNLTGRQPATHDPVVDMFLSCHRSVSKQLADLKGLVLANGIAIQNLREQMSTMPGGRIVDIDEEMEHPDDIPLPCESLAAFDLLEQKIETDSAFRKRMRMKIRKTASKERPMNKCLSSCIKLFISQTAGMSFVPLKATKDKRVFKETTLCRHIEALYSKVYGTKENPLTIGVFGSALQGIFHNVKDWTGPVKRVRSTHSKKQNRNVPLDLHQDDSEEWST